MSAAALESVQSGLARPAHWELQFLGPSPGPTAATFGDVLGGPVRPLELAPDRVPAPTHAEGPIVLIAVDVRGVDGASDDRALAVRIDPGLRHAPPLPPFDPSGSDRPFDRLAAWVDSIPHHEWIPSPSPVGETGRPPTAGRSGGSAEWESTARVSEGALLPWARYREGIPAHWRLEGARCEGCGRTTFPARGRCRGCGRSELLTVHRFPREDLPVVATTRIGPGAQPTEFDVEVAQRGAYQVVLVDLGPHARATLQATDPELGAISIGGTVETVLRRTYAIEGEWRYARKARPSPSATPAGAPVAR